MENRACGYTGRGQFMELFSEIYNLDEMFGDHIPLLERAGLSKTDLPDYPFDVEAHFEKVSEELADKDQDYSQVLAEILNANKEIAVAHMKFHVTDKDVLDGLDSDDFLKIPRKKKISEPPPPPPPRSPPPPPAPAPVTTPLAEQNLPEPGPLFALLNVFKTEVPDADIEEQQNDDQIPLVQFHVKDIATQVDKVVALQDGEPVPDGYQIVSKNLGFDTNRTRRPSNPAVPLDLPVPALEDHLNLTNTAQQGCSQQSSPNSIDSSGRLNSLNDLMRNEVHIKMSQTQGSKDTDNNNATNTTPVMNNAESSQSSSKGPQGLITPNLNVISRTTAVSEATPSATSICIPVIQQKPSASVTPNVPNPASAIPKKRSFLFCCKMCKEYTFPNYDTRFRKHMFFKHQTEITDADFESSKVFPKQLMKCRKCGIVAVNKRKEHRLKCLPNTPEPEAFIEVHKWSLEYKYKCGVQDCREAFEMRYKLKEHLHTKHPSFASRVILDPDFRCAKCLKRFNESYLLGQHVVNCKDSRPSQETILELARSTLYCEYCETLHAKISDATSCYLSRVIFRCVLCMAVSKEKRKFYDHLRVVHGLILEGEYPQLKCPMCDFGPAKYTVIFPHIVMEHYSTALKAFEQQARTEGQQSRNMQPSSVVSRSLGITRAPDFRPPTTVAGGSFLNSSITPTTPSTVGTISSTSTAKPPTTVPQTRPSTVGVLMGIPPSRSATSAYAEDALGTPRKLVAVEASAPVSMEISESPALSLPVSATILKLTPIPTHTSVIQSRPPQVGLVRPFSTPTTQLLQTANLHFTTSSQMSTVSSVSPTIANVLDTSRHLAITTISPSFIATSTYPPFTSSSVGIIQTGNVPVIASARGSTPGIISGQTPVTVGRLGSPRAPKSVSVPMPPPSMPNIVYSRTTTTSVGLKRDQATRPGMQNLHRGMYRGVTASAVSTTIHPRIVTINDRTYECIPNQNPYEVYGNNFQSRRTHVIETPSSTSTPAAAASSSSRTSYSGLTTVRQPQTNPSSPFRMPGVPATISVHPPVSRITTNQQQSRLNPSDMKSTFQGQNYPSNRQ